MTIVPIEIPVSFVLEVCKILVDLDSGREVLQISIVSDLNQYREIFVYFLTDAIIVSR